MKWYHIDSIFNEMIEDVKYLKRTTYLQKK